VWFASTVIAVTLVVAGGYRFTRFGLNTRAATETEKGAVVSRLNPDRIAAANWMISGVAAGIAGILIAPIVPMVPVGYTLFIVPALAAALVGQFQYMLPAVAAGFAIGMVQSELTFLTSKHPRLPQTGLPELVPLVLILLVLVVRGRPLPTRGSLITQTLGRAPRPRRLWPPTVIGTVAGVVGVLVLHGNWRDAVRSPWPSSRWPAPPPSS
jgi:branched-subunit amino acid ABC-type transport system permease component